MFGSEVQLKIPYTIDNQLILMVSTLVLAPLKDLASLSIGWVIIPVRYVRGA